MHHRDSGQPCAAVISRAASVDIGQRLADYERGYADGQAERRSG